jgi:demethylmenaquinone methyltransferase/2-methoxy-6-polyprenyl-1,4-benzoquinol methylase
VGLDFADEMLRAAQAKGDALPVASRPRYVMGDALALPFPDGAFDCLTTGFALRNVTSIPATLAEMRRVLRDGGRVACLELTPPQGRLFPAFFCLYFGRVVPVLGRVVAGNGEAYSYLPASLVGFPSAPALARLMREAGFRRVTYRLLMFGTVALHVGER